MYGACHLFRLAKAVSEKRLKRLITDGLPSYHDAYMREYRTNSLDKTTHHIRNITLEGTHNNNKMERLNEEIRDREKVMRSLKKPDTPILAGMQIFHNYVRSHESLDGRTPSEVSGIQVNGEDRWLTLIQNASMESNRHVPPRNTKNRKTGVP